MKNTYKIPDGCTEISIEQDGDMIITKFEKAIPKYKKGDILFEDNRVMIYDSKRNSGSFNTICLLYLDTNDNVSFGNYYNMPESSCRLATKSEAQSLFDALSKAGKQWNAEKLCIEGLKVEPKVGDCVRLKYINALVYAKIRSIKNGKITSASWFSTTRGINYDGIFTEYDSIQILTPTQFQYELYELGFEYDFETDKIRERKWKPTYGSDYFSISAKFEVVKYEWHSSDFDMLRYKMNMVFNKLNKAQEALEKIKNALK